MKPSSLNCYMTFWDMIICSNPQHWSDISLNRDLVTELDLITVLALLPYSARINYKTTFATGAASQHTTLNPPETWSCSILDLICSHVETIRSWTCHVYGPIEFRTSLGTSILLLLETDFIWFWSGFWSEIFAIIYCIWKPLDICSQLPLMNAPAVLPSSVYTLQPVMTSPAAHVTVALFPCFKPLSGDSLTAHVKFCAAQHDAYTNVPENAYKC